MVFLFFVIFFLLLYGSSIKLLDKIISFALENHLNCVNSTMETKLNYCIFSISFWIGGAIND